MAHYLILTQYVGPTRHGKFDPADGDLLITTEPGRTNQSHEVRTEGWLGTSNDTAEHAHGEYETLEAAQARAAEMGYAHVLGEDGEPTAWDDYDYVVEVRRTERDSRAQWDAGDWLQATIGDLGITAASTDADLEALVERLTTEAHADGVELSRLSPTLESHRQELRDSVEA